MDWLVITVAVFVSVASFAGYVMARNLMDKYYSLQIQIELLQSENQSLRETNIEQETNIELLFDHYEAISGKTLSKASATGESITIPER